MEKLLTEAFVEELSTEESARVIGGGFALGGVLGGVVGGLVPDPSAPPTGSGGIKTTIDPGSFPGPVMELN